MKLKTGFEGYRLPFTGVLYLRNAINDGSTWRKG